MIRYPLKIVTYTSLAAERGLAVCVVLDDAGEQVFPTRDTDTATLHDCQAFVAADTDEAERELDEGLRDNPHVSARWLGEMGKEQRSN